MSDNRNYVIKNVARIPVGQDGPVREYITRSTSDAPGGRPVAFKKPEAEKLAKLLGMDPDEAVVLVPDDMVVVLDDGARELPHGEPHVLDQFVTSHQHS